MASEKVDRFVEMLAPAAVEIGAKYGLDPALIISQSALETGWGGSVAGNNYFGVKSHGQPGGKEVTTHEEVNGQLVKITDNFRQYDGVRESMEDYAKFLQDNPRYGDVFTKNSANDQIDAVAAAGYATDSNYASKLKAIAQMINLEPYRTPDINAYAPRLPAIGPTGGPALRAINVAAPQAPKAPQPGVMRGAMQSLMGGVGNIAQQAQPMVMRAAQRAAPSIMRAALGSVAGRSAIINPAIQNVMAGNQISNGSSAGQPIMTASSGMQTVGQRVNNSRSGYTVDRNPIFNASRGI